MPDETNTPIAPDAQDFHENLHVQTLLTFAFNEREVQSAWLIIDALYGLECLTLNQAWGALSARIVQEFGE